MMTNRWVVDGRTGHGIPRIGLTNYIHWLQKEVNKTRGLPVEKEFREVLRGARRRRNWLIRTGQWPPKEGIMPLATVRNLGDGKMEVL